MIKGSIHPAAIAVAVGVWLTLIGTGFWSTWLYAYTPGPEAAVTHRWPADVPRDGSRPTLVMLLHAECACSDASLGELSRIMARTGTALDVRLIFTPLADDRSPFNGRLWAHAASLPGVALSVDAGGELVRKFGGLVSGQTLLFDRDGALLFSGGITAARGHAGDNDGADAIVKALREGRAPVPSTPVFGCLLHERVSS